MRPSASDAAAYRAMLRLLPARLRAEYAEEMEAAFLEQLYARDGRGHRLRTWGGAVVDVLGWAVRGRVAGGRRGSPRVGRDSPGFDAKRMGEGGMGSSIEGLTKDLSYAARGLRRRPAFAAAVILVATLGIGANTAIFTVVNELLLRQLPVEDPGSLVDVVARVPGGNSFTGFAFEDYRDLRDRSGDWAELAAFTAVRRPLGAMGDGERVTVQLSSANYFDMLGLSAPIGRLTFPEFRGFGTDPVAVVSHTLWARSFGQDRELVGSTLIVGGQVFTVIGIGPEGFSGTFIGFPVDVWVPLSMASALLPGADVTSRVEKRFELVGRLVDGVTPTVLAARLDADLALLEEEHPVENRGLRASVYPTTGIDHSLRMGVRAFLAVLAGVALLVLLIACLNIGSLLLARAATREKEIAIRMAIGAGRVRVVTQFMLEALILIGVATISALLLGGWLTERLQAFAVSSAVPIGFDLEIDRRVLGFTAVVAFLTAIGAAGTPVLHWARKSPLGTLRETGAAGGGRSRLRSALVMAQVAASVVLLIGAGLFVRALQSGLDIDPGFDAAHVAVQSVTLDRDRYPDDATAQAFGLAALDAAAGIPDVRQVALSGRSPVGVARTPMLVNVPGHTAPSGQEGFFVDARRVSGGYFDVLGLPMRYGRPLLETDSGESPGVVVSAAFVARFWPGQDPVGLFIDVEGAAYTVVGVAQDARYLVQDQSPDALVYLPWRWVGSQSFTVVTRSAGDASAALLDLSASISALDPFLSLGRAGTLEDTFSQALLPQRVAAAVLGILGVLGLLLTSVGVYGVVQFSVTQATQELGVRIALGGDARHVVGIVLRKGLLFMGTGAAVGILVALLVSPALGTFLIDVSPADPVTYVTVVGVLAAVGVIASAVPAARALRLDPVRALRSE